MFSRYLITALGVFTIVGCTHIPSSGERMVFQSESTKHMGEEWIKGEKVVLDAKKLNKKGEKLVKNGNNKIDAGYDLIAKGKKQVELGNSLMQQASEKEEKGHVLQIESEEQFKETLPEKSSFIN